MIIWLKHPAHGVKDCYSENEACACEKNGWERFDPNANKPAVNVVDAPDPVADEVVAQPVHIERKKPGPKPKAKG